MVEYDLLDIFKRVLDNARVISIEMPERNDEIKKMIQENTKAYSKALLCLEMLNPIQAVGNVITSKIKLGIQKLRVLI